MKERNKDKKSKKHKDVLKYIGYITFGILVGGTLATAYFDYPRLTPVTQSGMESFCPPYLNNNTNTTEVGFNNIGVLPVDIVVNISSQSIGFVNNTDNPFVSSHSRVIGYLVTDDKPTPFYFIPNLTYAPTNFSIKIDAECAISGATFLSCINSPIIAFCNYTKSNLQWKRVK